ncbi:SDR family oxidoreductase [Puteibacter caeruleilacunae]|nr:SDR family oxidoreductase [Puteibacter caeruleilacunae]
MWIMKVYESSWMYSNLLNVQKSKNLELMKPTALITGSAKRIGNAIARHLAEQGWNIAIHYHSSVLSAARLKNDLSSKNPDGKFELISADLNDLNAVEEIVPTVIKEFGTLDLIVNNASIFNKKSLKETTIDFFDAQMQVNFKAPMLLTQVYSRLQEGGLIINLLDTRVTGNQSDYAAYSLSKKLLWEFTKMAAVEYAPAFRINGIAPGATLPPADKDKQYLEKLALNTPMEKPTGVDPILKSIDYVINNEFLTGQLLFCDGGENLV